MPRVFGSYSPWLRHPAKPFRPTRQPRTLQEGWTPFQLSDVALELDALDKEGVRTYVDEKDGKALKRLWASDTWPIMADKVSSFIRREMKWSKIAWKYLESEKACPWKVSDFDVLSAALRSPVLGSLASTHNIPSLIWKSLPTDGNEAGHEQVQVLLRNGISPRLWRDPETLLRWLLHRQSVLAPMVTELDAVRDKLKSGSPFRELRRLVAASLQTQAGLEMIAQRVDEIAEQCSRSLTRRPDRASRMLRFVNNLCIALENGGLPVGVRLCGLGLRVSAEARQPRAALKYWTLGLQNEYFKEPSRSQARILRVVLSRFEEVAKEIPVKGQYSELSPSSRTTPEDRAAWLHLLTGQGPTEEHTSQTGLGWHAIINFGDARYAQSYADALGRMGSYRILLFEYHRLYHHLNAQMGVQGQQQRLQLSALAKGLLSAAHVRLSSHETDGWEATIAHEAEQFQQSFQNNSSKSIEECLTALLSATKLQVEQKSCNQADDSWP